MVRLTAPNGAVVDVSDEKAKRLLEPSRGFKAADSKKTPAKKAASSKSDNK